MASAHGYWAAATIWFTGLWSSNRMVWGQALTQSWSNVKVSIHADAQSCSLTWWQLNNKCAGYTFFRWYFFKLASQSFKCCQEFINCLSITKLLFCKLFKCHEHIYGKCSGEGTLDFLDISSLLSCQYTARAPPVTSRGECTQSFLHLLASRSSLLAQAIL